jgi:hypothetical protein
MSFYRIKNKMIFRRYRTIRKIIWSFRFTDSISFSANIMLLINLTSSYTYMVYGEYECLLNLDEYYATMCIDEMHKRIKLEIS